MAFNFGNLFSGLGNLFSGFQQPSYNYRPQPAPSPGASIQRSSSFLMNPNTSLSAQVTNPQNLSNIFRSNVTPQTWNQPLTSGFATPNLDRAGYFNRQTGSVSPYNLSTQMFPHNPLNLFGGTGTSFLQGGGAGNAPSGFGSVGTRMGQNVMNPATQIGQQLFANPVENIAKTGKKIGQGAYTGTQDFLGGAFGKGVDKSKIGKTADTLTQTIQQLAPLIPQASNTLNQVGQAAGGVSNLTGQGSQMLGEAKGAGQDLLGKIQSMLGGMGGLGMLGQLFGGAGGNPLLTMLMGQMMGPKSPKMPDFGSLQSVQALQGFHPGTHQPLDPAVLDSIRHELDIKDAQEMRELQAVYHNARPGTDYTTDSAYQRDLANLQRAQGMRRADSAANAEFENMRIQLGASQQEMQKLSELAQLDVSGIMAQLGVSSQEAMQFKEQFGNIASLQMMKNLWPNLGGRQQQPTEQPQTAKVTS